MRLALAITLALAAFLIDGCAAPAMCVHRCREFCGGSPARLKMFLGTEVTCWCKDERVWEGACL